MLILVFSLTGLYGQVCTNVFAVERNLTLCASNIVTYVVYDGGGNFVQNMQVSGTPSGVNLNSWNFNPGSSSIDVDVNAITDYHGFGEIILEVMDQMGNTCFLTVTVVECCDNTPGYDYLFVNEYLPPINFFNSKVIYYGDVTVENTEFDHCEVLGGVDAQLIVVDRILGNSSRFSNLCGYRWDRIYLPNGIATLALDNCTLEHSLRGAFTNEHGLVDAQSSVFNNNMISLYVLRHTAASGPYNGSYVNLSGCTFTDLSPYTGLGQHPSSTVLLSNYRGYVCSNPNSTLSIGVKESNGVRIGESINTLNTFENPFNNGFDKSHIEVDDSYTIIENNEFSGCCQAICSYTNSRIHVGGLAAGQKNVFNDIGISAENSAVIAENNDFYDDAGITMINPSYLNVTSGYLNGDHLTNNTFFGPNGHIAYLAPGNNSSYSRIFNNTFSTDGVIEVNNFTATGAKKLIIHSNTFSSNGNIRLYNVDNAVVANNTLSMAPSHTPSASATPVAYGIDLLNATNATIKSNSMTRYNRGVQIAGNCAGTQFTCNTLTDNYYGFYLDVCYIDHQGTTGNTTGNVWTSVWPGGRQLQGTATQLFSPRKAWFYSTSIPNQVLNILPSPIDNFIRRRPEVNINPCTAVPSFKTTNPNVSSNQSSADILPAEVELSDLSHSISIFPNPVNDYLTVQIPKELFAKQLILATIQGQVILTERIAKSVYEIDFSGLASGTYVLRIGVQHYKVVK